MKKHTITALSVVLLIITNCTNTTKVNDDCALNAKDSAAIYQGIIAATDSFTYFNNHLNGDKIAQFWDNSADFLFIQDTTAFSDYEIIYKMCITFYSAPIDSTHLIWSKREVLPITKNKAHLYGKYEFYVKDSAGQVLRVNTNITALMTKSGSSWKVLRGQEVNTMIGE